MRYTGSLSAVLILGLVAVPAAAASTVEVTADAGNTFSPSTVQIVPGDSVVFRNQDVGGAPHNVKFDDGSFTQPNPVSNSAWSVGPKVFPNTGTFRFFCELHGTAGGVGMAGQVVAAPPGVDITAPRVTSASLKARRGRKLRLTFRTSERGQATIKFTRRVRGKYRKVRNVRRGVAPGKITVDLARTAGGRKLVAGRYRATITARDGAGNVSRAVRASARLK
jgi:plastocyanin